MTKADIIIIGAGPGGYATAAEAAADGLSVVIVERDQPGGTCLNRGCIPTKALCRSAEVAETVAHAADFGIEPEAVTVNYAVAAARKDEVVAALREGVVAELRDCRLVYGEARFVAADTVEVGDEQFTAPKIIVATGSRPAALPVPGAELAVDSDFMLAASTLPESIVIIGGGVIGMEFASILASFGVKVTVVEYCREILPQFDAEIAKRLRMSLKRKGINIITSAAVKAIYDGPVVEYESKGKPGSVQAETVLMAVGRVPVIPEGLTELGVTMNRKAIAVNDRMETSVPGIFAVGDVNGLCMLAHAAEAQGRVALGKEQRLDVIPSAVFTVPECAMVGSTEEQCKARGLDIKVGKATYRANGKALAMGEPDGLVKIIADASTGDVLGCHICGAHAADLIQEAALAMGAGLTVQQIAGTVHGHPTLGEVVKNAARAAI